MKRDGTIGAATFLALAAVVGVSLQSGSKPEAGGRADNSAAIKRTKPSTGKTKAAEKLQSGCGSLKDELENFLDIRNLSAPKHCYEGVAPTPPDLSSKTAQLKFVIATLPDPVHTHLPILFDQFAVAIQEGAQDEKYDFDSSWLPWDEEDPPYALLADQKTANAEKERKEEQPGIILFRRQIKCPDPKKASDCKEELGKPAKNGANGLSKSYREGLVVFVVGEEATEGIHRAQFSNALEWIDVLKPKKAATNKQVAILGPTFSGSFPSLTQVLSESDTAAKLNLSKAAAGRRLAIYSGSVSGQAAASAFQNTFPDQVTFHSFVRDDDAIVRRFCDYIAKEQPGFQPTRVAIVSEDETAYGSSGIRADEAVAESEETKTEEDKYPCPNKALKLYYPRDISSLRAAYQTKSLFDVGASSQPTDIQRRNLPSDLADPSGKVHDSIRSYGGNQTPLNQEAFLLEIVTALRAFKAHYIFLRGSNTLDQLFLTNFLGRGYPDGRIVIFGSDLMFIRERGTTGLGGTMILSTYPLFPLERDWTEHQSLAAADRVFSTDTSEGTYVALRLLLNDKSFGDGKFDGKMNAETCQVRDEDLKTIFLPSIACKSDPIPDYSPPFWTLHDQCGEFAKRNADKKANKGDGCPYPGPATWLSVIGTNRFWPMASLTNDTPNAAEVDQSKTERGYDRDKEPGGRPTIPVGMKVFLLVLMGFSFFHAWCCWSGSYTAKPAFRAHFASNGKWRHTLLVFCGSCCVAFMAIVAGWGCGVFAAPVAGLENSWRELYWVRFICVMAALAILLHNRTAYRLAEDCSGGSGWPRMSRVGYMIRSLVLSGFFLVVIHLFYRHFVVFNEDVLLTENRVLTYWRAMNLASGVSPMVPILLFFAGLYLSFWFTLHGLALFGPDRPCLPAKGKLTLEGAPGKNFLRMFSQDAANAIERVAKPLTWDIVVLGLGLFVLFLVAPYRFAGGRVPVRSLGAERYAIVFLVALDICCTLAIVETWRLCHVWEELRRLLAFIDRLPLRRTMASLHGFSWGGVWRMSGNVLEVRYKVISRQTECMHHTIASLEEYLKRKPSDSEAQDAVVALREMRDALGTFAHWYSIHYAKPRAGDLTTFENFQESIASASGIVLSKLLVPAWRREKASLLVDLAKDEKDDTAPHRPHLALSKRIQNAEEFVCLNYLAFAQNVLGRLRTMTLTIMLLLIVSTVAMSTYPFDPRQALSAVLIVLFGIVGLVVVKVYAEMHRDSTLSHVTNTKPGELGAEFWFKIVGFGLAPLLGLLARVFPGVTDFIFSWLQPSISSLK